MSSGGGARGRALRDLERMLAWKIEKLEQGSFSPGKSESFLRSEIRSLEYAINMIEEERDEELGETR